MGMYKSVHEGMKHLQTIKLKSRYIHEPRKENRYYSRIRHDPAWKSLCINLYSKDNKNW